MRVMIVDDEPLARRRLSRMLARIPGMDVVAQAADAAEARALAHSLLPDLALLDIDMPGCDGLTLARELGREIAVVFTTAHRKHAVEAFALAAVDCLLKPIEEARLLEALERVKRATERPPSAVPPTSLASHSPPAQSERRRASPIRLIGERVVGQVARHQLLEPIG